MINNLLFGLFLLFYCLNTFSQTIIRMEKVNGVYQIPCKVNGIDLKFILDTGASDIVISKTEANFLVKQGLINENDIVGTEKYRIADGSITEGTKIIIREIKIRDIFINDVYATVIDSDIAPLLFGQSALSKFGRFEIEGDILRIYPKETRNDYEFLGIDLTKTIDDFGFSRANLDDANPLYPVSFEWCNVSKEHDLSEFSFEIQNIVFGNSGKIIVIALSKEPKSVIPFEQENFSKEFFEKLYKTLSAKYGSGESKMAKSAEWKARNFDLVINIDADYRINLLYIPKIFVKQEELVNNIKPKQEDLKSDVYNGDKPLTNMSFEDGLVEEDRNFMLKLSEFAFQGARSSEEDISYFDQFIDIQNDEFSIIVNRLYKSSVKASKAKKVELEIDAYSTISYNIFSQFIVISESSYKIMSNCKFKKINFIYNITYSDNTTNKVTKSIITPNGILPFQYPFTESEFISVLH